jgi:hypothetical protein
MQLTIVGLTADTWKSWPAERSLRRLYADTKTLEARLVKRVTRSRDTIFFLLLLKRIESMALSHPTPYQRIAFRAENAPAILSWLVETEVRLRNTPLDKRPGALRRRPLRPLLDRSPIIFPTAAANIARFLDGPMTREAERDGRAPQGAAVALAMLASTVKAAAGMGVAITALSEEP